jgi:hypothetical protein
LRPEGDAGYVVTGERQLLATFGQTFAFIVALAWPDILHRRRDRDPPGGGIVIQSAAEMAGG